jgi:hypothetical protein
MRSVFTLLETLFSFLTLRIYDLFTFQQLAK